jgi:hypothetical protein
MPIYLQDEKPSNTGKIPTFQDYVGGTNLTPEEYNLARQSYLDAYLERIADSEFGQKPKKDVTEWKDRWSKGIESIQSAFEQRFPEKKVDTFADKAANYGHAAATGVVKGVRWITDFAGEDNPMSQHLSRVVDLHQSALTATEKLLIARSQLLAQSAQEAGVNNLWRNVSAIRMTAAIETLVLPLLLLTVVLFRKRHRWAWPRFKMPAFRRPVWPWRQKMVWSSIAADEAKAHPMYGIKNGLILLALFQIWQPIVNWGTLQTNLMDAKVSLSDFFTFSPSVPVYVASLMITLVCTVVICWAMFTKHPRFRHITSWTLILSFPAYLLAALIFPAPGMGQGIARSLVGWLIFGSLWLVYVQRSQRVRVTFEHKVKTAFTPEALSVTPTPSDKLETLSTDFPELPLSVAKPVELPLAAVTTRDCAAEAKAPSATEPRKQLVNEETLWAEALREFESADRKTGLWAKCYAQHQGQDAAAKAAYLTERVEQLHLSGWAAETGPSPEHELPS